MEKSHVAANVGQSHLILELLKLTFELHHVKFRSFFLHTRLLLCILHFVQLLLKKNNRSCTSSTTRMLNFGRLCTIKCKGVLKLDRDINRCCAHLQPVYFCIVLLLLPLIVSTRGY